MATDARLVEAMAAWDHSAWSGWMKYLWSRCDCDAAGNYIIPREWRERWERQMKTPYADLREDEKESDRKEARVLLTVLDALLGSRDDEI